jgi:hypothetical protein
MCKHPVQSTTTQLTLLLAAADKEQRRALYANDTEDERLGDTDDEHIEDLNDSDDDGPNDSDDDTSAPQSKRVRKARKQGGKIGEIASGFRADTGFP